ncbi:hypothetical protein [Actinomadura litoris]|uniref:hypothetical protein n=1 Tax=Actinomadura litoris TaxID=2678616 RepID=UPI001FA74E3F|nr:hypothetical protein [Actinomadura litoris]
MTFSTRPDGADQAAAARIAALLADRDDGRCAACGQNGDTAQVAPVHRRRSRLEQGDRSDLSGWLLLCGTDTTGCRGRIEDEPGWARETGLTVAAHRDPADVPVWHALHGLVWLDAEGGVYPAPGRGTGQEGGR